jgi:outer membrane protein assembly factor BamB
MPSSRRRSGRSEGTVTRISRRSFVLGSAAAAFAATRPTNAAGLLEIRNPRSPIPQWQQFKGDPRRTGRSRLPGPLAPSPRWDTRGNPSIQSSMCVAGDGTIYLDGDSGVLFARSRGGRLLWTQHVADTYCTAGTALLDDGSILAVPESGVAAVYAPDGERLWTYDLRAYSGPDSTPLVAGDGTIYLGNQTGLHAVRPDGTRKWVHRQRASGAPAEGLDGTIYFPSSGRLVAVAPDGTRLWSHASGFGYGLGSAPAVGDDGAIYVTGILGQLLAVNPDGTRRWVAGEADIVTDVPSSPAIGLDGVIYYGSSYTWFNAINPDGSTKWRRRTITNDSFSAPTIGSDGTIYFGAATGKVHAFSPDGEQIWERVFGDGDPFHYVRSAPVVMSGRRLLVGAYDGVFVVGD